MPLSGLSATSRQEGFNAECAEEKHHSKTLRAPRLLLLLALRGKSSIYPQTSRSPAFRRASKAAIVSRYRSIPLRSRSTFRSIVMVS
jgi:hypothetical protein